jgi:hypothetical protein
LLAIKTLKTRQIIIIADCNHMTKSRAGRIQHSNVRQCTETVFFYSSEPLLFSHNHKRLLVDNNNVCNDNNNKDDFLFSVYTII